MLTRKSSVDLVTLGPGDVVADGYEVEAELGSGAMGVVYRARDKWLGRPVALKLLRSAWTSPHAEQQLQREARAIAALRCQHVVQVYTFGQHRGAYFFAMEYIVGRSLETILEEWRERDARLPLHRVITILTRIAKGLDAVHAARLVHRDVKPANIVIEEDTGRPVLVDFGLAIHDEDVEAEELAGTPHYMAPEQLRPGGPEPLGRYTDVYALGCVAFEMLTGRPPFEADNVMGLLFAHEHEPPPPIEERRPELAAFGPVFQRALAKRPADRYQDAASFAQDLELAYERSSSKHASIPPPLSRAAMESIGRPLRVLVVDDDPAFGKFAARAAQLAVGDAPLRLAVAASGHEATEHARYEPPDLVMLDLEMPDLDGVETLSRLRALPRGERARVVVLSGGMGPQERWRFSVMGVRDFLAKPVDLRRLVGALADIVQRTAWSPPGDVGRAP